MSDNDPAANVPASTGPSADNAASTGTPRDIDLRVVMAEIYEDVARRRRSGEFPPGLERELDHLFAEHAPPAAVGDDIDAVLARAEDATFIDADVPIESKRPGASHLKRVVRKLTYFYMRYLAAQLSSMGDVLVRALRLIDRRVRALEAAVPSTDQRVLDELARAELDDPIEQWIDDVLAHVSAAHGRVLHAQCGSGAFVAKMVEAGVDAYGIDPRRELLGDAIRRGLDVRPDAPLAHLRAVEGGALGGLVLSRCVDVLGPGAQLELADRAGAALAPGGRLALVVTTPEAWGRRHDTLTLDLAGGRPLHAQTWWQVLQARGFSSVTVRRAPREGGLEPVADGEGAAIHNANIELLNELLFPSASYAVFAVR